MPTYLTPGVYIEEVPSGVKPIEGAVTSVAAFIGVAERGPVNKPVSVTKIDDFEAAFGGYLPPGTGPGESYLTHAVAQFFDHGGSRGYMIRIANDDANPAKGEPLNSATFLTDVNAAYQGADNPNPGAWANDHYDVFIEPSKSDPDLLFDLQVRYWPTPDDRDKPEDEQKDGPTIVESYTDLSHWPDSRDYGPAVVNDASKLVSIEIEDPRRAKNAEDAHGLPADGETYVLLNGSDGTAVGPTDPKLFGDALRTLDTIRDVRLIAIPGIPDQAMTGVGYCDNRPERDCLFFMDPPQDDNEPEEIIEWSQKEGATPSSYAVLYYPWIKADNYEPKGGRAVFPPSGFVMGMYGRIDNRRGVWKAPAGLETALAGARGLTFELTDKHQERLNPRGINCLRKVPGVGTVIWGTRMRATRADPEWRYVPVRRTAIMIERSIYGGIQWAVFEPNDHRLWSSLRTNIDAFMNGLFRAGAFQGEKASDAYFVRCGLGDTMTQGDIDRGQVIVLVGFAPLKPAEFVIIRIQQKAGQQQ